MNETQPSPQPERSAWLTVPVSILVAATMVSVSILFVGAGGDLSLLNAKVQLPGADPADGGEPTKVADPESLIENDDPSIGSANAPVTIVEFSDFECPFCAGFWRDTYPQIRTEYIDTGKVRFIFRDYPLPFHPAAKPAALAANCAFEQGKFWEYHDKIFAGQAELTEAKLKVWAQQLGLNTGTFNKCLDSAQYSAEVDADVAVGSANGVSGTPSFFVNGQLLVGAQPFAQFKALIDAELE